MCDFQIMGKWSHEWMVWTVNHLHPKNDKRSQRTIHKLYQYRHTNYDSVIYVNHSFTKNRLILLCNNAIFPLSPPPPKNTTETRLQVQTARCFLPSDILHDIADISGLQPCHIATQLRHIQIVITEENAWSVEDTRHKRQRASFVCLLVCLLRPVVFVVVVVVVVVLVVVVVVVVVVFCRNSIQMGIIEVPKFGRGLCGTSLELVGLCNILQRLTMLGPTMPTGCSTTPWPDALDKVSSIRKARGVCCSAKREEAKTSTIFDIWGSFRGFFLHTNIFYGSFACSCIWGSYCWWKKSG